MGVDVVTVVVADVIAHVIVVVAVVVIDTSQKETEKTNLKN